MVKTAHMICGVLAAGLVLTASFASGQRVQFPSAIPTNTAQAVPPGTTYGNAPGYPSGTISTYGATTPPAYGAATAPAYGGATAPVYGPGALPGYGSGQAPGPTATFQGNIQAPPAWDPYATPGCPPPTLFPQDPALATPGLPTTTLTTMTRFLQEIRLDHVWIQGSGRNSNEFGTNDSDISAEFAIPFLRNPQTPLLITPGFTTHFWSGPQAPDLPPRLYDAYLNTAWNPQFSRVFGGEFQFRIGVYSDFERIVNESIRYQGAGYGLISFSPSFQLKLGAVYLDRNRYKIFPAGGIVWTPNDDVRFEILFPNPKLAVRLPGYSTTEWWAYLRGEYGGGAWTVFGGSPVSLDYNDIRVGLGLDFETVKGLNGLAEVGITFEREFYSSGTVLFRPDPTVYVRGGLAY